MITIKLFLMNTFLFFGYGNRMLIFYLFIYLLSKKVQILKTEYKYRQYCTPLSQPRVSDNSY